MTLSVEDIKHLKELAKSINPNNSHGNESEVGQYLGFQDGFVTGYSRGFVAGINKTIQWIYQNIALDEPFPEKQLTEELLNKK